MRSIVKSAAVAGLSTLLIAGSTVAVLAQSDSQRYYHGPGMMWRDGMGGFGMMFGFVFMLILIAAVVIGAILLLRYIGIGGHAPGHSGSQAALDILRQRYARGEIDTKEYEERRKALAD